MYKKGANVNATMFINMVVVGCPARNKVVLRNYNVFIRRKRGKNHSLRMRLRIAKCFIESIYFRIGTLLFYIGMRRLRTIRLHKHKLTQFTITMNNLYRTKKLRVETSTDRNSIWFFSMCDTKCLLLPVLIWCPF